MAVKQRYKIQCHCFHCRKLLAILTSFGTNFRLHTKIMLKVWKYSTVRSPEKRCWTFISSYIYWHIALVALVLASWHKNMQGFIHINMFSVCVIPVYPMTFAEITLKFSVTAVCFFHDASNRSCNFCLQFLPGGGGGGGSGVYKKHKIVLFKLNQK
jgi:hypothetical protein